MAKLRFKKTAVTLRILKAAWQARPWAMVGFLVGAMLEVVSFLVTIYATAQLVGLLAVYASGGDTSGIWFWLGVEIAAGAGMSVGVWLMSWAKRLIYFRITEWSTRQFQAALCRLDIQDFYDDKVRNQINKAQSGYVWQISSLNEGSLDLVYALLRFVVTAAAVAQIAWWLVIVIAIFLLPVLFLNNQLAKVKWFVWDDKGDERHIFWGLDWLFRQPKQQMELRSSQARDYILSKIGGMNNQFYAQQERAAAKPTAWLGVASVLEGGGTAVGAVVALQQFLTGLISFQR